MGHLKMEELPQTKVTDMMRIRVSEWFGKMLSHGKWDERNEHSTLTSTIFSCEEAALEVQR